MWSYSASRVLKKIIFLLVSHPSIMQHCVCGGRGVVLEFNFSGIVFGKGPGLYHVRWLFIYFFLQPRPTERIKNPRLSSAVAEHQENTD